MATVIAFHAHPDDEVLLTGGTLARLAAEGHRVIIAVATDGVMGRASGDERVRLDELRASASVLGAARVVHLGYADSGHGPILYPDPPDWARFARADLGEAAAKLAGLIREEHADLLLSYDPQGGYGHRDHVRVHEVGARAAQLTGTRVLEATLPRELVTAALRPVRLLRLVTGYDPAQIRAVGTPRPAITHQVNVRRYARHKQAALAAHRSFPRSGGRSARLARVMLALPVPVFGLMFGREWFAEPGAAPATLSGDILQAVPTGEHHLLLPGFVFLPVFDCGDEHSPVSNRVRSAEFAGDSMGPTDVSICPFTVLARGMVPTPGIDVIVGDNDRCEIRRSVRVPGRRLSGQGRAYGALCVHVSAGPTVSCGPVSLRRAVAGHHASYRRRAKPQPPPRPKDTPFEPWSAAVASRGPWPPSVCSPVGHNPWTRM